MIDNLERVLARSDPFGSAMLRLPAMREMRMHSPKQYWQLLERRRNGLPAVDDQIYYRSLRGGAALYRVIGGDDTGASKYDVVRVIPVVRSRQDSDSELEEQPDSTAEAPKVRPTTLKVGADNYGGEDVDVVHGTCALAQWHWCWISDGTPVSKVAATVQAAGQAERTRENSDDGPGRNSPAPNDDTGSAAESEMNDASSTSASTDTDGESQRFTFMPAAPSSPSKGKKSRLLGN